MLGVRSAVYADDTSLFASDGNIDNLLNVVQLAQHDALNWFSSNKLFVIRVKHKIFC